MSQLVRIHYEDRESWLAGRGIGIGASEAAAVLGQSPWMTTMQLWKLKIGATQPKDLSGNPAVELGNRMEDAIRNLYAAQHPELEVSHYPYDILYQDDRPYIFATLDGELVRKETGQKGILEVKTSTPTGKVGWGKWQNKIPDNYFCQVIHQMAATSWDFVTLVAALFSHNGDIIIRPYTFERIDYLDDIDYLIEHEDGFWGHVKNGTLPPQVIHF